MIDANAKPDYKGWKRHGEEVEKPKAEGSRMKADNSGN